MSFLRRNLRQTITYWITDGFDSFGTPEYVGPYFCKARWEDKQEKAVSFDGSEITTSAIVLVEKDMGVGTYIALGRFNTGTAVESARELKGFSKIPTLKATDFERKAYL